MITIKKVYWFAITLFVFIPCAYVHSDIVSTAHVERQRARVSAMTTSRVSFLPKGYDSDYMTPAQYLASLPHPVFKPGNTLPPLTRWGWTLSYEMTEEMAHWGYALDLGEATASLVADLDDPYSRAARLISLVKKDPSMYKLCVLMDRIQDKPQPEAVYLHDAAGSLILPKKWSPQAPDSILLAMASTTGRNLRKIASIVPISVILNGGERGMGVEGFDGKYWKLDPVVTDAKGVLSWSDYASQRKAHQEMFFTDAAHSAGHPLYIFYTAGGDAQGLDRWGWNYRWMNTVSDLASNEDYSSSGNASFIVSPGHDSLTNALKAAWYAAFNASPGHDLLTNALKARGYAASFGKTLSYNWVSAGWDLYPWSAKNASIDRYTGFLKTLYTSGMIGAVAGYFSYPNGVVPQSSFTAADPVNGPVVLESLIRKGVFVLDKKNSVYLKHKGISRPVEIKGINYDGIWYVLQLPKGFDAQFDKNQPPHWILQIEALAQVHAEFSYLEDMLRQGDLLPGQGNNVINTRQPTYEFRTGYADTRVLVRKRKNQKRWLIIAWAADGVTRSINVTIPVLGSVKVQAMPAGCLYDARIVKGALFLTLIDDGSMAPAPLALPSMMPDSDTGP